jgi:hypothetical protein
LGLRDGEVDTDLWYRRQDAGSASDYRLHATERPRAVGACYAGARWVAGATYGWEESEARLGGVSVAEQLDLPSNSATLPRLNGSVQQGTVGMTWRSARWEAGAQHAWAEPEGTLALARGTVAYRAPLEATTSREEIYLLRRRAGLVQYLSGWSARGTGAGTVLTGLVGRADLSGEERDQSVGVGERRRSPRGESNWGLDWRRTTGASFDQGYAGLWPGLSAPVYVTQADLRLTTVSLRYGQRRSWSRNWQWAVGVALQHARVDGDWSLLESQGIGQNPRLLDDFHQSNGTLDLLMATPGLIYQRGRTLAMLTYTLAYGQAAHFQGVSSSSGSTGGAGVRQHLTVSPFPTFSFVREF